MVLFSLVSNAQSSIYFTQYAPTPTAPITGAASWTTATGAFTPTSSSTPWASFDNVLYPNSYKTSGSAGSVTINFSTPLTLTSNGSSKGNIIVHWGSVSNRPLNISINGAPVVQIDAITITAERNIVRTATYNLPDSTPDITSIRLVSSGGGNVSVFDLDIQSFGSLSTNPIKAEEIPVFYTNGNQVFLSNVKSNTAVSIYAITGALVRTFETNSDTSFELGTGLWIARVKTEEGEKTVKLAVR